MNRRDAANDLELVREERPIRVGRRAPVTVEVEFYRSRSTGEETLTPEQMDAAQQAAGAIVRKNEGLLLPEEIKAIRLEVGLSQADFEKLLGVGAKTVVRWERGTVFQNKSTDSLLRLIAASSENARYLAHLNGVQLPVLEESWESLEANILSTYRDAHLLASSSGLIAISYGEVSAVASTTFPLATGEPVWPEWDSLRVRRSFLRRRAELPEGSLSA